MSTSERVQLWAMRGLTAAEITHQTKLPRSTVKYHLKRFKETGSWSRREYPVRVKTLTPFAECIRKHLKLHPHASATELHELLATKFQLMVSVRTVQRYLKSAGRDSNRGQAQDNSGEEESDTSTTEELSVASGGEQTSVSKSKTIERVTTISYSTPLASEDDRRAVERRRRNAEVAVVTGVVLGHGNGNGCGSTAAAGILASCSSSSSSSAMMGIEPMSPSSNSNSSAAAAAAAQPSSSSSASASTSTSSSLHFSSVLGAAGAQLQGTLLPSAAEALAASTHAQLLLLSPHDQRLLASHQLHRQQQHGLHSASPASTSGSPLQSTSTSAFSSSSSASHSTLRTTHVSVSPLSLSSPSLTGGATNGGIHSASPSTLLSSSTPSTPHAASSTPQQHPHLLMGPSSASASNAANHPLLSLPFGLHLPSPHHFPGGVLLPGAAHPHHFSWPDVSAFNSPTSSSSSSSTVSASSSSPTSPTSLSHPHHHLHHPHLSHHNNHHHHNPYSGLGTPASASASHAAASAAAHHHAHQLQQHSASGSGVGAASVSGLPLMNTSIPPLPLGLYPVYPAFNTHNTADARSGALSARPQLNSPTIAHGAAATATLISPKVEPSLEALINAALVSD